MFKYLKPARLVVHIILIGYTIIALFPVLLIIINSFKTKKSIFLDPLGFPDTKTFSLVGYKTVAQQMDFFLYLGNSITVTVVSMILVIVAGAMAAFFLAEYRFKFNSLLGLYLAIGIMIPIRLGTVSILSLVVSMGLADTLTALILVYTAQGLPLSIFILTEFMQQVPRDLKDAARIDGVSEYGVFFRIVFPLIRPVVSTVAVFTMIPIWNDLWFPLILTSSNSVRTLTLGAQQFLGQFIVDWNAVLSSLSLAMYPVLILYIILSKQLIRGITSGAIK